jgi:hypothetical protein
MSRPTQADFATVRTASERWMRAWVDQDLAALDGFLAPDFTLVIGNAPGACVSHGEWLAMVPRYVCTRFAYHDVQLRALDDLVVMSAISEQQASVDGVGRSGRFFVTDAWRRAGGGLAADGKSRRAIRPAPNRHRNRSSPECSKTSRTLFRVSGNEQPDRIGRERGHRQQHRRLRPRRLPRRQPAEQHIGSDQ